MSSPILEMTTQGFKEASKFSRDCELTVLATLLHLPVEIWSQAGRESMPSKAITIVYNGFVSHYLKKKTKTEVQFIYNIDLFQVYSKVIGIYLSRYCCLVTKLCPTLLRPHEL